MSGCTGFLGKVVLEKLLRTCSNLDKIYVMVRSKGNKKPIMDRIKYEILDSYCFSRLA